MENKKDLFVTNANYITKSELSEFEHSYDAKMGFANADYGDNEKKALVSNNSEQTKLALINIIAEAPEDSGERVEILVNKNVFDFFNPENTSIYSNEVELAPHEKLSVRIPSASSGVCRILLAIAKIDNI